MIINLLVSSKPRYFINKGSGHLFEGSYYIRWYSSTCWECIHVDDGSIHKKDTQIDNPEKCWEEVSGMALCFLLGVTKL